MKSIHTPNAPAAIGPYSQAIVVDSWVFTAGQIALDPSTGALVEGGFEAQAKQVLRNLDAVLKASGCGFGDVVKTTIYLTDFENFALVNNLYGEAMAGNRPARSTVQAAALPLGALLEIDLVARIP